MDETDRLNASAGGCGAPPEPQDRNRAPAGLTREYRSGHVSVLWFAERCIHAADCIRLLPQVFDPERRPWVDVDAADADAIARAVLACPTGALQLGPHPTGPREPVPEGTTVKTVRNGPYFVRGPAEVRDASGGLIREDTRMALCRCGKSAHMPFCDNAHRATRFRDPGAFPAPPAADS